MAELRLDPWGTDYDAAYAVDSAAPEPVATVTVGVELPAGQWRPLTADKTATEPFETLVFIDGSRRMEARFHLEEGGALQAYGGLGTTAVGAVVVRAGQPASFHPDLRLGRWCFIGGGRTHAGVVLEQQGSWHGRLAFDPVPVPASDPEAIMQELQNTMRSEEANLSSTLAADLPDALIICDGPLPRHDPGSLLGYIKTSSLQRLAGDELEVARSLQQGERTPIYKVATPGAAHFEWVLRLRDPSPWYYSLAGTVRLQLAAPLSDAELPDFVKRVADWSCTYLPAFSSQAHQDPRAPQQLLPVRALETELKRRMGNNLLLRRRIVREYFAR